MRKKKIALFTAGEGHLSISQAIENKIRDYYQVEVFFNKNIISDLYVPIYQFFPVANKIPFTVAGNKHSKKVLSEIFRYRQAEKMEAFIEKNRPDLTISTYFMFNPNLERFKRIAGTPFINVVADPKTIHPLILSEKATTNLIFDTTTKKLIQSQNPKMPLTISGWFVRPQFEQLDSLANSAEKLRKKWEIKKGVPIFLLTSGSEGTTMIGKLLPSIINTSKPAVIFVSCGNNKKMYQSVEALQNILHKMKRPVRLISLGFIHNLQDYMYLADLVIGKAGPNTLFESVATLTPFFALTHISGQEDGNLDIIRDYNLGYVEENPFKVQKLFSSIMENPEQLVSFKPSLKKVAAFNRQSKDVLLSTIRTSLNKD